MTKTQEIENPESNFTQVLDAAAKFPGVRIGRAVYLRTALKRHCTDEQIERAVADSPATAGIPLKVIAEVAKLLGVSLFGRGNVTIRAEQGSSRKVLP